MRTGATSRGGVRAVAAAGAALVGVALAACTGGGETDPTTPAPSVTATASPTPTPTPTPTSSEAPEAVAPERPAEMDEPTLEGAEATALYFLSLYGYAYATGDLDEWNRLSHSECIFCASLRESVEKATAAGEVTAGGEVSAELLESEELAVDAYRILARTTQAPWTAYDASGEEVGDSAEASVHYATVIVLRESGSWSVRGVELDA